jgi:hypothetical protein
MSGEPAGNQALRHQGAIRLSRRPVPGLPLRGWNDELDPAELSRQAKDFAPGDRRLYIHSREGLETPYLGERWMACVRAAVAEAKDAGLEVWIYDEDRWPSGFAGGKVPARGEDFRAKGLTLELGGSTLPPEAAAGYALRPGEGDSLVSFRRLSAPDLAADEVLAVLRVEVSSPSDWFNGEAPPDNLNPDCVDAFLAETHDAYERAVGGEFGRTVRGFFFDEPGVHDRHAAMTPGRGWIPWTSGFSEYFHCRRGYDVLDAVPLLFFDGPVSRSPARLLAHPVGALFRNLHRQDRAWCAGGACSPAATSLGGRPRRRYPGVLAIMPNTT